MPEFPLSYQLKYGSPIPTPTGITLQPVSRALRFHLGRWTGFVWNRPVGVRVTQLDGQQQMIPIHDVTRRRQVFIVGAALLVWLLIVTIMPDGKSSQTKSN